MDTAFDGCPDWAQKSKGVAKRCQCESAAVAPAAVDQIDAPIDPCHLSLMRRAIALAVLLTACRDDTAEVLTQARNALATKDDAAFLALCEPQAAQLLAAVPQVVTQSGRVFKVLREGRPTSRLLPDGEIASVEENGHRAIVVTRSRKAGGRVPMRLIAGQWRIDLLEMPQFAAAIRPER